MIIVTRNEINSQCEDYAMEYEIMDFNESKTSLMAYITEVESVHTSTLGKQEKVTAFLGICTKYGLPPMVFE